MTPLLKLQLTQSTTRKALSELMTLPEEKRSESFHAEISTLTGAMARLEDEIAAARVLEADPETRSSTDTSESREWRALEARANIGDLFDNVLSHAAIDGPMREIQQALSMRANEFPLNLLETRAVTPAPANGEQNQAAIIPYVFPRSVAAYLGVDMPTVGVGEAVFPVLTSELSVGTPAENAAQAETTGAFSAEVLSPSRIQASFFYSREDRARFASMDTALRENLSMGLEDGLDAQVVSGPNGLLTGTNLANHAAAAATTFANFIRQFAYARVDGRYAVDTQAVKSVMGSTAYGHAGETYRATESDRTALDRLMEITGGVRVSAHVPAAASDKQNAIIRLGNARDMVAAIWSGIALIPDEITKAANGQIVITAVMLHAVKILRTAAFFKQEVNTG